MKKVFVLSTLCLCIGMAYGADATIQASLSNVYSLNDARKSAFEGSVPKINVSNIPAIDPRFKENQRILSSGGGNIDNRLITVFSSGFYGVTQKCSRQDIYYFPNGQLYSIEIDSSPIYFSNTTCPANSPRKAWKYSAEGKLVNVAIYAANNNAFIFNADGRLSAYWHGRQCYHSDGSSCGTRQTLTVEDHASNFLK